MDMTFRAKQLRLETLQLAIEYNNEHIGPAFSIIELLIAIYDHMQPEDKFILSKGHGCLSLYAILKQQGFNPTISGHPDIDVEQGIFATTGSLGHGLPLGVGMALSRKLGDICGHIYVLVGDGELQEGTTWESLLFAAHHNLNNLTVIVDKNCMQALGETNEILNLGSLWAKFSAFNWCAIEIDGHNMLDIKYALREKPKRPKAIIAHTIKGKGIPQAENNPKWHNYLPKGDELKKCINLML